MNSKEKANAAAPPAAKIRKIMPDPQEGCSAGQHQLSDNACCDLCLLLEKNSNRFGPFIEKRFQNGIMFRCHYFCLLSCNYIQQKVLGGEAEAEQTLGYDAEEIENGIEQFRDVQCFYCPGKSAPVKCSHEGCGRTYHYVCGYQNNCLTEFCGQYASYCHDHYDAGHKQRHVRNQPCWICWDEMPEYHPYYSFCSECAPEDDAPEGTANEFVWYHRQCIQRYALGAGSAFKCPHCQEKEQYTKYARLQGIFIPARDASWETDGSVKDVQNLRCTAADCRIPTVKGKPSQMVGCSCCGGKTVHLQCSGVEDPRKYVCSNCENESFIKLY